MSYKTYENYKDSGIKYINKIPEHWDLSKFKIFYSYVKGKNPKDFFDEEDENLLPYLSMDYLRNKADPEFVSGVECSVKANNGDVLLLWDGSNAGEFVVSKYGAVASTMAKLIPNMPINNSYSKYLCKFIEPMLRELTIGMGVPHVNSKELSNLMIPFVGIIDQEKIANYLDKKILPIDENITKNKELISLLEEKRVALIHHVVTNGINPNVEMKKTTVPWAEYVPMHWNIYKGKNILVQLKRYVKSDDNIITCFRDGEVTLRSKRREDGFTMSDKEIGYQGIEKNDLVVHGMDGFAGAIGISDSRGKGSPVLIVLDSNQNKKYLMYYLRNLAYNNVFLSLSTGIRVRSCDLRWEKIANLPFLTPPIEEQKKIADYLDNNISSINKSIEKIKEHIQLLEEYKASLIYHVVTGKIDVRDEV